jgi:lipoprotein signal peptidase
MRHQRELRVVVGAAAAVLVIDQVSKLAARGFGFGSSMQNDVGLVWWAWLLGLFLLVDIAALGVIASRRAGLLAGLIVGGVLGNALDALVWPGGIPDFIRIPWGSVVTSYANLADVFILVGIPLLVVAVLVRLLTAANRGWSLPETMPGRPGAHGV